MAMRITTLIENSRGEHLSLRVEHGISFLIENEMHSILFDTGQSSSFITNAAKLGLDLGKLTHVVLSHGHYDHSGGLQALVDTFPGFELVMGQGFFEPKYAVFNDSHEFLGNDFDEEYLKKQMVPYRFAEKQITEITPGVYVITRFNRTNADEVINPRFVLRRNNVFVEDKFEDEVLLAVDTPKGVVVVLGCSHPGMKNMLETVSSLFERPIYAVLGGTHLVESSDESLEKSLEYLGGQRIQVIGVSHCTGQKAMDILGSSSSRFFHNRTGSSLFID